MQRTPPWHLGSMADVRGAGSLILVVRHEGSEVLNRRKLREQRGDLHLRFLRCLLWILGLAPRTARISFRVFGVFRGYLLGAAGQPPVTASLEILAGEF